MEVLMEPATGGSLSKTDSKAKRNKGDGPLSHIKVAKSHPKKVSSKSIQLKSTIRKDPSAQKEARKAVPKAPKPKTTETTNTVTENKDLVSKYPILKNTELVQRFLRVPLTNNQKGRIRVAIKESLMSTSNAIIPDIVNGKIQAILKSSDNLTDSQLRRIRILYNLLKSSLKGQDIFDEKDRKKVENNKLEKKNENDKVKGPKRYVVFVGNLPLDIDKEKILTHFSEMNEHIVDVRIPKPKDGRKSATAYLELTNEASYEFALSKHHSMLGNKRINVLYTAQKNGKITKAEAKSKTAKLIAMQKAGQLIGSIPLSKKRSQRRLKLKRARAKQEAERGIFNPQVTR